MTHRFAALALVLAAILLTAAGAAVWVGVCDLSVASTGPKRYVAAEELQAGSRGWFGVDACVRHDLAVVVTAEGTAYRLGEPGVASDDGDRIYTPLSAASDCADDRPPAHLYALVEDADSLSTTFQRAAHSRIAPPPIAARVDGVIGPRVGDARRAKLAANKLAVELPDVVHVPLLKKDARPPVRWVAYVTIASGLHGFLLFLLGLRYTRRRARRRDEPVPDDAEEQFFHNETLD